MQSPAEMNKPLIQMPAQAHNQKNSSRSQLHDCITMTVGICTVLIPLLIVYNMFNYAVMETGRRLWFDLTKY